MQTQTQNAMHVIDINGSVTISVQARSDTFYPKHSPSKMQHLGEISTRYVPTVFMPLKDIHNGAMLYCAWGDAVYKSSWCADGSGVRCQWVKVADGSALLTGEGQVMAVRSTATPITPPPQPPEGQPAAAAADGAGSGPDRAIGSAVLKPPPKAAGATPRPAARLAVHWQKARSPRPVPMPKSAAAVKCGGRAGKGLISKTGTKR